MIVVNIFELLIVLDKLFDKAMSESRAKRTRVALPGELGGELYAR